MNISQVSLESRMATIEQMSVLSRMGKKQPQPARISGASNPRSVNVLLIQPLRWRDAFGKRVSSTPTPTSPHSALPPHQSDTP